MKEKNCMNCLHMKTKEFMVPTGYGPEPKRKVFCSKGLITYARTNSTKYMSPDIREDGTINEKYLEEAKTYKAAESCAMYEDNSPISDDEIDQ